MERLALILINSCLLLACSGSQTETVWVNRNTVAVQTIRGNTSVNGKIFTGSLFQLSENGDTLSIEFYKSGKEHGPWKNFYENGRIMAMREFKNGKKVGRYLAWWPNGMPRYDYTFVNDEFDGSLKEWDEQGRLVREATYKDGHEEGPQKMWYPNGKIRSNYIVKNGRRFGLLGTKNCVNVSDSIFLAR